jgi:hypothetical protein
MNIEILNWWGHHEKGARGGVNRTRGDEPTGVSISNQQKTPCFSFMFFSYTTLDNRRAEQVLPWGQGGQGKGQEDECGTNNGHTCM